MQGSASEDGQRSPEFSESRSCSGRARLQPSEPESEHGGRCAEARIRASHRRESLTMGRIVPCRFVPNQTIVKSLTLCVFS